MSLTIYVLDTSYLDELAGCDGYTNPAASARVRTIFAESGKAGARFFVPLPCVFELGNHIAQVKSGGRRRKLCEWLGTTVESCLSGGIPWHITPTGDPADILPMLMARFQDLAAHHKIGLVDSSVIAEAERLKAGHDFALVHIWTNDREVKAREPDAEDAPIFW